MNGTVHNQMDDDPMGFLDGIEAPEIETIEVEKTKRQEFAMQIQELLMLAGTDTDFFDAELPAVQHFLTFIKRTCKNAEEEKDKVSKFLYQLLLNDLDHPYVDSQTASALAKKHETTGHRIHVFLSNQRKRYIRRHKEKLAAEADSIKSNITSLDTFIQGYISEVTRNRHVTGDELSSPVIVIRNTEVSKS